MLATLPGKIEKGPETCFTQRTRQHVSGHFSIFPGKVANMSHVPSHFFSKVANMSQVAYLSNSDTCQHVSGPCQHVSCPRQNVSHPRQHVSGPLSVFKIEVANKVLQSS